jgi:cytochrome b subunit of formate dehydrogenase
MQDILQECGGCHDDPSVGGAKKRKRSFYETYRESYHGQVTALGETRAARCSDCHGAHDIRPTSDPASRLHPDNRAQTCRACHPGANENFVQFEPHADYRDAERYPLLYGIWLYFIIVMSGAFGFYGLHSLFWFVRSVIERRRHGPHPRFAAGSHAIQRFTRFDRINHAFVIISFFGLTLTGLPLRFSDHHWAQVLAGLLGGGTAAGLLHRFFAIMLICNFAAHFYGMFKRSRRYEKTLVRDWVFGPNTMLPRMKDIKDCLGMFRWFFAGGKKPAFDRWTYWEKFDYTAEVAGSLIIGGSGLLLWFPEFFSRFLPGWVFNAAMIVHGYEALLAVGFIFTIHFFNAHLRLEKFPVDDVIFTGRLSEEEFKHERGVEYARLVAAGQLEALKVPPAPRWQRRLAVVVGLVAMAIGTTLVALIILAGLGVI